MTIAAGSGVAQILAFVASLGLTRLFSPGEFGIFAAYYAISQLFFPLASLRYANAIMLPAEDRLSDGMLYLSLAFTVALSVLLEVVLLAAQAARLSAVSGRTGGVIAAWLAVSILLNSVYQCYSFWAIRREYYADVAGARVLQVVVLVGVQLAGGIMGLGPSSLVAGDVFGLLAGCLVVMRRAHRSATPPVGPPVDRRTRSALLAEYRRFPILNTWGTFIDGVSQSAPALLILHYFGGTTAGLYALCFQVINSPMGLVGRSLSVVFYRETSARWAKGQDIRPFVARAIVELSAAAAVIAAIPMLVGPQLFGFVFGHRWTYAGEIGRILAPSLAITVVASNVSAVLLVRQQQLRLLVIQCLLAVGTVVPLIVAGVSGTKTNPAFVLYSASQFFVYAVYLAVIAHSARLRPGDVRRATHDARATVLRLVRRFSQRNRVLER